MLDRRSLGLRAATLSPAVLAAAVGLVCLIATAVLWHIADQAHEVQLANRFEREVTQVQTAVVQRVELYASMLDAVRAFVASHEHDAHMPWRRFTEALGFPGTLAGLDSLIYVEPSGDANTPEAMVVRRVVAPAGQGPVAGADIASPLLRTAAQEARVLGLTRVTTAPLSVPGSGAAPSYHFVTPVKDVEAGQRTIGEAEDPFRGWLVASFRPRPLLQDTLGSLIEEIHFHAAIRGLDGSLTEVYDDGGEVHTHGHDHAPLFQRHVEFTLYGQHWVLDFKALDTFARLHASPVRWVVIVAGLVISALAAFGAYAVMGSRRRAVRLAKDLSVRARHQAQRARTAERRLRDAVESISEGFVLWGADDRLVMCNRTFSSMYPAISDLIRPGVRFEDVARAAVRSGEVSVPPDQEDTWLEERRRRHRSGNSHHEQMLGDGRWILVSERHTSDGGVVGIRADITAIKLQGEALRESEERFRMIAETTPVALFVVEATDGAPLFVNRRGRALLDDLFGEDGSGPEWLVASAGLAGRMAAVEVGSWLADAEEVDLEGEDGRRRWLLLTARGIAFQGRRAVVMSVTDITHNRETQAQLVQASKMATLGEMATGIAHELNQPLTVIRMAAERARKLISRLPAETAEGAVAKIDRIVAQVDRAAMITGHMRSFGRRSSGAPEDIDPAAAIAGAIDLMGEQLRARSITLEVETDETLPFVKGNATQLEQVLLNLLVNARDAVDAQPAGAERRIAVAARWVEARVTISIHDTGGGIDPQVRERVFEPFFTTKEVGAGTGLGLSISYGIVRDMGGTITVENSGPGACFTIVLPAIDKRKEAS